MIYENLIRQGNNFWCQEQLWTSKTLSASARSVRLFSTRDFRLKTQATTLGEGNCMYFAQISLDGPVKYWGMDQSIAILDAPENAKQIGTATCSG
jgi:hypothetical protein